MFERRQLLEESSSRYKTYASSAFDAMKSLNSVFAANAPLVRQPQAPACSD